MSVIDPQVNQSADENVTFSADGSQHYLVSPAGGAVVKDIPAPAQTGPPVRDSVKARAWHRSPPTE